MKWIERQRYFLDFTLSSFLRRKYKNGALLLVYTAIVFLLASVVFFTGAIREEAAHLLAQSPEMLVQRTLTGRYEIIPLEYIEKIKGVRGVESVKGRLWGYYYDRATGANYTLIVPEQFGREPNEAIAGSGVYRLWVREYGDEMFMRTYDGEILTLKIVSEIGEQADLVASDLVLVSEPVFRRIFGIPEGFATDLVVEVRNVRECPTIAEKILKLLPDTRPILREEILRTYSSLFDWRSGYTLVLLAGAVFAFFIFAWDKATGLSGEEKAEIGILKALGWETSDILFMKFWEGLVVSLTAFLAGTALAYLHVFLASAPLFEHALRGWSVLYPKVRIAAAVDPYQFMVLFALTVLPYAFVTIIPAWRAAVTDPQAALR